MSLSKHKNSGLAVCVENCSLGRAGAVLLEQASSSIGRILLKMLLLPLKSKRGPETRAARLVGRNSEKLTLGCHHLYDTVCPLCHCPGWGLILCHLSLIHTPVHLSGTKAGINTMPTDQRMGFELMSDRSCPRCPCTLPSPTLGPLSCGVLSLPGSRHCEG